MSMLDQSLTDVLILQYYISQSHIELCMTYNQAALITNNSVLIARHLVYEILRLLIISFKRKKIIRSGISEDLTNRITYVEKLSIIIIDTLHARVFKIR